MLQIKGGKTAAAIAANKFCCARRYGLTGTVMQNNYDELWCILNWARPGVLKELRYMRKEYTKPILQGQKVDATPYCIWTAKFRARMLKGKISKVLLRRGPYMFTGVNFV